MLLDGMTLSVVCKEKSWPHVDCAVEGEVLFDGVASSITIGEELLPSWAEMLVLEI